jgi:hypothetical protein
VNPAAPTIDTQDGPNSGFPFAFSLYDNNGHYSLYITDEPTEEHQLILEVRNKSGKPVTLYPIVNLTDPENSHFELCFRKGTLSQKTLRFIKRLGTDQSPSILSDRDEKNWDISLTRTETEISLFFRYIGGAPLILEAEDDESSDDPRKPLIIVLQNFSADAGGGARGTRVKFVPHKLGGKAAKTRQAYREHYLSIINHLGNKYIPLHVGFVGSNHILNDGVRHEDSQLKIRIQNIVKPRKRRVARSVITLQAPSQTKGFPGSLISLVVDLQQEGEQKPWALAKSHEFRPDIKTSIVQRNVLVSGLNLRFLDEDQGMGQSRVLSFVPEQNIDLEQGDYIDIDLSGFQTSLPAGTAYLYVHYHNIPGYQDGYFALTIQKTPLLFSSHSNMLGGKLTAAGDNDTLVGLKIDPIFDNSDKKDVKHYGLLVTDGNVGIGTDVPEAELQILGVNQDANNGTLILGPTGATNLRLGYDQEYSWIQSHGAKPLAINPIGNNVGVGTNTPQTQLDVVGTVKATKFVGEGAFVAGMIMMWSGDSRNIPTGWALCDGQSERPDLRGKFIIGGNGQDQDKTGGAANHTHPHTHIYASSNVTTTSNGAHNHGISTGRGGTWSLNPSAGSTSMDDAGVHSHSLSLPSTNVNTDAKVDHLPPYYTLCFIIKL